MYFYRITDYLNIVINYAVVCSCLKLHATSPVEGSHLEITSNQTTQLSTAVKVSVAWQRNVGNCRCRIDL